MILDDQFRVIKGLPGTDNHEFKIDQNLDSKRQYSEIAHLTEYKQVRRDLSAFGVVPDDGNSSWVVDCHFRAVDLSTNAIIFEWSSLDHVPLSEGLVRPTGGINGRTKANEWDYL